MEEAVSTNSKKDWRVSAMVVLGNCGGRRHSNLVKVRGEDITIYGGVIRIFIRKNRTDFFNGGSVCTSAERGRAIDVKAYLRGLGLQEGMLCVHQELEEREQCDPSDMYNDVQRV